jgi:stage IV sporulation protein FB
MTAPITAARTGGLRFRLAGIPVTIHVSFLLVVGLLGLGIGDVERLVVWVLVATAAVLLHELGHGLVGRAAGLQPRIDLAGFGGVTSWSPSGGSRGRLGRGWSLAISLAGPGIGFAGGLVALLVGVPCCRIPATAGLAGFAAGVWLFASFAWGVLNLLPILPLDGGQALRELLPGTPEQRLRRAAAVGVAIGVALVVWALLQERTFLTLLAGWITWSNVQLVRDARDAEPDETRDEVAALQQAAREGDHAAVVSRAEAVLRGARQPRLRQFALALQVRGLLASARPGRAYRLVVDPRRTIPLPTELVGAVVAAHPDRRTVDAVVRGWAARSGDRDVRGLVAVVLAAHGHHEEVGTLLAGGERGGGPSEPVVDAGVAIAVQAAAHADGQWDTAAATGWELLTHGGLRSPVLAYDTACSLARAGRPDEAVRALSTALRLGFADVDRMRRDHDLLALHDHPAWPRLAAGEPVPDDRGDHP